MSTRMDSLETSLNARIDGLSARMDGLYELVLSLKK